jgi:SAM-dependent methyltransferase
MRVLEIGCGPGVAARAIVEAYDDIYVLAIDRSAKAIQQAKAGSVSHVKSGKLEFRNVDIHKLELKEGEAPFDLAFAVRVGDLDGRHPDKAKLALPKIAMALTKKAKLFIDGGDPLTTIDLKAYRR